jgi:hypothetical protein
MGKNFTDAMRDIQENARKLEAAATASATSNAPSQAEVLAGVQKANAKENEFNNEKALIDGLLDSGETLHGIISESGNTSSVQGRYTKYLNEKIKEKTENIVNLKHDDKFFRRDFISAYPLLAQAGPFWQNSDNWVLSAFWLALVINMIPISLAVFGLPLNDSQKWGLILATWFIIPLFILYLLQSFG